MKCFNLKMSAVIGILGISLFLSSCLPGGQFFEQAEAELDAASDVSIKLDGEKAVGTVSATSTVVQKLAAPAESALSGTELSIPPGTLQIDMAISMEESLSLASGSSASALGVSFGSEAGKAVNLANDQGILELPETAAPMTLRIPVAAGLRLQEAGSESLVTLMRQALSSGDCIERIYPPTLFTFSDSKITIDVRSFAAYQPIYMPTKELERKLATSEKAYVEIERPGCRIVTKTEEKSLPPVKISSLSITLANPTLTVAATVEGDTISSCKLYGKDVDTEDIYSIEGTESKFEISLSGRYRALNARFSMSCELSSGQTVDTPFASYSLASRAFPLDVVYGTARDVTVSIKPDFEEGTTCDAASWKDGVAQELMENIPISNTFDFSKNPFAVEIEVQITCTFPDGGTVVSEKVEISLDALPTESVTDEDLFGPIFVSGAWDQTTYNPGDTAKLVMDLDDENDISQACLALDHSGSKELLLGCYNVTPFSDAFEISFTIPTFVESVTYGISEIVLVDSEDNYRIYRGNSTNSDFVDTDIGNPLMTIAGSSPDTTAPTVSNISISNSSISVPASLTIEVNATDDISGVSQGREHCAEFYGKTFSFSFVICSDFDEVSAGTYQMSGEVPVWVTDDDYFLKAIDIYDVAGNHQAFSAISTDTIYPTTSITVPLLTTSGGVPDTTPPTVTDVYFNQSQYKRGDYGYLYAVIEDVGGSGLAWSPVSCWVVEEGIHGPDQSVCNSFQYEGNDLYRLDFYIPYTQPLGTYYLYDFNVIDQAGNATYYYHTSDPPTAYSNLNGVPAISYELVQ